MTDAHAPEDPRAIDSAALTALEPGALAALEPGALTALEPGALTALEPGALAERLGIVILEAAAQRAVGTMPVAGNTQPFGLLHGGATAALAETVASLAAMVHAGPGRIAVGIDLNATHHRSVRDGLVTATATAAHLGRTAATYEVVVRDAASERVCTARLTCLILDARPE